jgi:hypothetical protein
MKTENLRDEKLWTTPFIKITLVSLLVFISYQMQTATLPLYVQHIGGTRTDAGLMMSVFTISLFFPATDRTVFATLGEEKSACCRDYFCLRCIVRIHYAN